MDNLRERAEKALQATDMPPEDLAPENAKALIHELRVHQMELELQNEELRQTQAELEESHQRYRELYEHAPVGYCTLDTSGRIAEINQTLCQYLELSRSQLLGTRFFAYLPADDADRVFVGLRKTLNDGSPQSVEAGLKPRSDRHFLIQVQRQILAAEGDPQPKQAHVVILDISHQKYAQKLEEYSGGLEQLVAERTLYLAEVSGHLRKEVKEREQAEEAVEQSERQYLRLAEQVPDGIHIVQQGALRFVNQAFANTFDRSAEQLIGASVLDLIQPGHQQQIQTMLRHCEEEEHSFRGIQFPCIRPDGREVWVESHYAPLEWQGEPAALGTLRDISERHQWEMKLAQQNLALKESIGERYQLGPLIGRSAAMQVLYEQILRAAESQANVIIYGETGVGKDLVAHTVHQFSARRKRPFVVVNCAAINEDLFESAFFGHRKGAFTGAVADQTGYFEAAHHGVLFLDEIAELTPEMQATLLRALEDGEYTPVGTHTPKKADIRIIAATNRDLQEGQTRGTIRSDFFYRVHVLSLTVPPLRERTQDVPLLVDHFLAHYTPDDDEVPRLPGHLLDAFVQYEWPGNVRELQNLVQQYLAGQTFRFPAARQTQAVQQLETRVLTQTMHTSSNLQEALEYFEHQYLLRMLEQHHWHKANTAKALGIPRRTLYRKLKKYGIS